jgi:hypothetical protein
MQTWMVLSEQGLKGEKEKYITAKIHMCVGAPLTVAFNGHGWPHPTGHTLQRVSGWRGNGHRASLAMRDLDLDGGTS